MPTALTSGSVTCAQARRILGDADTKEEIRCGHCKRKLAEAVFEQIAIKCPRCGTLNHLRAASPTPERPDLLIRWSQVRILYVLPAVSFKSLRMEAFVFREKHKITEPINNMK